MSVDRDMTLMQFLNTRVSDYEARDFLVFVKSGVVQMLVLVVMLIGTWSWVGFSVRENAYYPYDTFWAFWGPWLGWSSMLTVLVLIIAAILTIVVYAVTAPLSWIFGRKVHQATWPWSWLAISIAAFGVLFLAVVHMAPDNGQNYGSMFPY